MLKILFICHGNICRSPMAEFIFRDMAEKQGFGGQFYVASAATSSEALGWPVHRETAAQLKKRGISAAGKYAVQLKKKDYQAYDYLIGMEDKNIRNIVRIIGKDPEHKVYRLLDFTDEPRDIEDPWYTGEFGKTYDEIEEGCEYLLAYLLRKGV